MMGLGYSVDVEASQRVTKIDDRRHVHVKTSPVHQGYGGTTAVRHCQVNRNLLFSNAESIRTTATNQRLSWHVDQWDLQKTG